MSQIERERRPQVKGVRVHGATRSRLLPVGFLVAGFLGACGGRTNSLSEEERQSYEEDGLLGAVASRVGDGDGDGDPVLRSTGDGDGDGDYYGDGDGDYYGDGDGDGDYYGDGDGDYYGDGDYDDYDDDDYFGATGGIAIPRGIPGIIGGGTTPGVGPGTPDEPLVGCERSYGESERGWCDLELECDNGYQWSNCYREDDGWYCSCDTPAGYANIKIEELSDRGACLVATDYCGSGQQLVDSDEDCETVGRDEGSGYCSLGQECTSASREYDDAIISQTSWKDVWCEDEGDEWTCDCYDESFGSLGITFVPKDGSSSACVEASDICGTQPIVADGGISCSREYQSASKNWCDLELRCSQDAEIDGREVAINGWAYANCEKAGDELWECYCEGLGKSGQFQVEGDNPWDSCESAGELCADLLQEK